jgi:hypothetical protein
MPDDPKPRPRRGLRPGAGTDRTTEQELGLEGTIMSRVLKRLIEDMTSVGREAKTNLSQEESVLGQFLRDIAFLPGIETESRVMSDSPAAMALARELGQPSAEVFTRTRGPLFNERGRQGLIDLASIFTPRARVQEPGMGETADASVIARGRLLERVAAQQALDELLKPRPKVAEQ